MPAIKLEENTENCTEVFTTTKGHTCRNVLDTTTTTIANKSQHESTSWIRKNSNGILNTKKNDLDGPLIHASRIDKTPHDFSYTNQRRYSNISPPSLSSLPQSFLSDMLKTANAIDANLDRQYSSDRQVVSQKTNNITPPPVPARLNKSPALPERKNAQKSEYSDNVESDDRAFSNNSYTIDRRLSTESACSTASGCCENSLQMVKIPPPPQSSHSKRAKIKPPSTSDVVTDADKITLPNGTSPASASIFNACTPQQRKSLIDNEASYFKFPKVCSASSDSGYNCGSDEANAYSHARRKSGKKIPPPLRTCPNLEDSLDDTTPSNVAEQLHGSMLSCSDGGISQTSSPSYLVRSLESPLLPKIKKHHSTNKHAKRKFTAAEKLLFANNEYAVDYVKDEKCVSQTDLTKSQSTPAVLQTVVDYQHGSSLPSYRHKVIKDERRNSCYVSRSHLKFQFAQIVINVIVLLAVAGTLAWYFRAFPVTTTVKYINHTIISLQNMSQRPVPFYYAEQYPPNEIFYCPPMSTRFCLANHIPYNYTVLPNTILGTQREADEILNAYQAISNVRCYQLAPLFLCSLYLPKCDENMASIHPCRNLCHETYRRCGIFFKIFGLRLPEHIDCDSFPDSQFPDECIGNKEVLDHQKQEDITICHDGFQCDHKRCIPADWRCDGHIDCKDQKDESNCTQCPGQLHCGHGKCIATSHICDGVLNCPWGQDERNCVRLNEQMGDVGYGSVEVFVAKDKAFQTACIRSWDQQNSPTVMCQLLGYKYMNYTTLESRSANTSIQYIQYNKETVDDNKLRLFHELKTCVNRDDERHYPIVKARCSTYECGVRKQSIGHPSARIVGGQASNPGDWPFLAAILGGPKEIFYCAGVLISDQWVLSAAHCVGDFNLSHPPVDWTIQLGMTRRSSHSYFGQKLKVQRVIPHPKYNQNVVHNNDIALFQLNEKVKFHDHLLPVCMPSEKTVLESSHNCTVIGWGRRSESDVADYERTVFEVRVPIVNRSLCNAWLKKQDMDITQSMICAGYEEGGKDACQGDSGGPLLCQNVNERDRWFVAGIVSWGMKCAHPYLPGIYANVPYFLNWINEQMKKFSDER